MSLREVYIMEAMLDGPFGRLTLSVPVLTIGRISANQLVLNDRKASGHHAEIRSLLSTKNSGALFCGFLNLGKRPFYIMHLWFYQRESGTRSAF